MAAEQYQPNITGNECVKQCVSEKQQRLKSQVETKPNGDI